LKSEEAPTGVPDPPGKARPGAGVGGSNLILTDVTKVTVVTAVTVVTDLTTVNEGARPGVVDEERSIVGDGDSPSIVWRLHGRGSGVPGHPP
jgi:hypothetical protein